MCLEGIEPMNIETALKEAMNIEGALGAALALDRGKSNLAPARHQLRRIENDLSV